MARKDEDMSWKNSTLPVKPATTTDTDKGNVTPEGFADYVNKTYSNTYGGTNYGHDYMANKFTYNFNPGQIAYKDIGNAPTQAAADQVINAIKNRQPFQYDVTGDALYNQYKNQYLQQGKMAMMDANAQASAMTGGYGNSYASMVGNQAYQASVQQLNNIIPELYQLAYDKYRNETQDLYNQYGLYDNERNNWQNMQQANWQNKLNAFTTNQNLMQAAADGQLKADMATDDSLYKYNNLNLDVQKLNDASALNKAELDYKYNALDQNDRQTAYEMAYNKWKDEQSMKAKEDDDNGGNESGETVDAPTETQNTKLFMESVPDVRTFERAKQSNGGFYAEDGDWIKGQFTDYEQYLTYKIKKSLDTKKISEAEAEYLIEQYHLY